MDSKKSNIRYILFIAFCILWVVILAVFSTRESSSVSSVDYDTVFSMGDWHIKITDAVYTKETGQLSFTFYTKEATEIADTTEPQIVSVLTDGGEKKDFYENGSSVYARYYTVEAVDEDFSYVTINFESKEPDTVTEDSVDEFGGVIKGEVIEGDTLTQYVRISRKSVRELTLEEKASTTTTTAVITTAKKSDSNNYFDSYDFSGGNNNNAEATTTTTTTKPVTTTTTAAVTTKSTTQYISVVSIKLDTGVSNGIIGLDIGGTAEISAVISPASATDRSVEWKSNRTDIAVVDENGKITAVGEGKAIITATTNDGGLSASCMVEIS